MGATMDKREQLLKRKSTNTRVVSLDDIDVVVRGLSRQEVTDARDGLTLDDGDSPDAPEYERRLLAAGMVDPVMSYEDISLWINGDPDDPDDHGAPAGDSVAVMTAIQELSGLAEDARKSHAPPVRRRRRR